MGCLWLAACLGCANNQEQIRQSLLESRPPPAVAATADMAYRVACPDVLTFAIEHHPELSGQRVVEANGCVDLGKLGGVRVEGLTVQEIADQVRLAMGGKTGVRVAVAEYRSQQVYLFGQVQGLQRAVAYQGPETVVDVLRRAGGITHEGAPCSVTVVRAGTDGHPKPPMRVDLEAILVDGDSKTNVLIEPFDQIKVGESRKAIFNKCVHPWLRPFSVLMREEK